MLTYAALRKFTLLAGFVARPNIVSDDEFMNLALAYTFFVYPCVENNALYHALVGTATPYVAIVRFVKSVLL
jgi:NAD(P)H-flavin reductase